MKPRVALTSNESHLKEEVARLARRLGLPVTEAEEAFDFVLRLTPERLELAEVGAKTKPIFVDFTSGKAQYRQGQRKVEPLARAVGVKGTYRPSVLDATAGLGQDAFVLAAHGCQVMMVERSVVVAALLEDGLRRANQSSIAPISGCLSLRVGDARDMMGGLETLPEVIYIDPMYPDSGKSAAKRKAMRFFRTIIGDDLDAEEVLKLALKTAQRRVVVKRPLKAEPLGGLKPDASHPGKTTRFDLYLNLEARRSVE